ncbi:MAG: cardiolipin synthase [Vicinamibacterales bacterium]
MRKPERPGCRGALAGAVPGLALVLVAGCSVLPVITPDMGWRAPTPVQLDDRRGPLSAKRSKAILARLEARGEPTGIFDRHLALEEEIAGSPLVTGNRVTLLKDGPSTFQAMFDAIAGARSHVDLETYIIEDDEVGRKFADALVGKQATGVQVSLIYDSVGSMGTPKAFFERLRAGGVKVLEYNPVNPMTARVGWDVNQRDHRKLLVVDGRTAFIGGINISSVYSGGSFSHASIRRPDGSPPWRDTHMQVDGPVVAEFQKLFLASWEKQKGDPLAARGAVAPPVPRGSEVVRAIGSSPDEPFSLIYATLISAIGSAETSVSLTNAYFVPDPQLLAALIAAAGRGVDVRLILPGKTDSWLVFHAGRSYYSELLRGGVKIHERRGALLHAKTALVDDVWSTVGSTNLDWRSFLHNDEVNAVVLGQGFGEQMRAMFEDDLAASDPVLLEEWERRSLGDRLKEMAAQAWKYWL